jgi:restriction system protein
MAKSKWASFFLCLFLGVFGAHKFYEGRVLLGVLYIFTGGLFGIGVIIDLVILFFKPNPYHP